MRWLPTLVACVSFLCGASQNIRLQLPVAHTDFVNQAAFSHNEKYLATCSFDNTIKIWDVRSGNLLRDLPERGVVWTVAFHSSDSFLVAGSNDSVVTVWNIFTGRPYKTLRGHVDGVPAVKYSNDGTRIFTGSHDGSVRRWNFRTGALEQMYVAPGAGGANDVEESPDGKRVLASFADGSLHLWDVKAGQELHKFVVKNEKLQFAEFSPDGNRIVASAASGRSFLWNARGFELLSLLGDASTISDENRTFQDVTHFDPKGEWLVSRVDSNIKLFNLKKMTGQLVSPAPLGLITSTNFSSDGTKVFAVASKKQSFIFDLVRKKMTVLLAHYEDQIYGAFSNSGRYCVTTSFDNSAIIWDAQSGSPIHILRSPMKRVATITVSPNGKELAVAGWDTIIKIWDLKQLKVKYALRGHWTYINKVVYNPDGTRLLSVSDDGTARMWDAATGQELLRTGPATYENFIEEYNAGRVPGLTSGSFSPDGLNFATIARDGKIAIYNSRTGHLLTEMRNPPPPTLVYFSVQFNPTGNTLLGPFNKFTKKAAIVFTYSPDGRFVALAEAGENVVKVYDAKTNALLRELKGHSKQVIALAYSNDGRELISAGADWTACLWNMVDGSLTSRLSGHSDIIFSCAFSKDGSKAFTGSWDGTVRVWDRGTKAHSGTLVALDGTDCIAVLPNGYYKCSPGAAKLLNYTNERLDLISFNQLDLYLNRPDLVVKEMGNSDSLSVLAYNHAYIKRIKRAGLDTLQLNSIRSLVPPQLELKNKDSIKLTQITNSLRLHFVARDSSHALKKINIWINEVPLFTKNGLTLARANLRQLDTTITVELAEGHNSIEASATNELGVESYRTPLNVWHFNSEKKKHKMYFIGIATDHFRDSHYNLKWAVKDVRDLARTLSKQFSGEVVVDTLFNEKVTVTALRSIQQKLKTFGVNDKVIIAYSGHGLVSKNFDYFLSTSSTDFENVESGSIAYEILDDLLDNIKPRRKLLLIDACYSGEIDKEGLRRVDSTVVAQSENNQKGVKPVFGDNAASRSIFDLMKDAFADVKRSTGATVISASGGTQAALENGELKNGVFTFSVQEYLLTAKVATLSGLRSFVARRVSELTKGQQTPTARSETLQNDWLILK